MSCVVPAVCARWRSASRDSHAASIRAAAASPAPPGGDEAKRVAAIRRRSHVACGGVQRHSTGHVTGGE